MYWFHSYGYYSWKCGYRYLKDYITSIYQVTLSKISTIYNDKLDLDSIISVIMSYSRNDDFIKNHISKNKIDFIEYRELYSSIIKEIKYLYNFA